jgi:hypothetical protein
LTGSVTTGVLTRNLLFGAVYINATGKAIPVTGRGGPEGCETSRLPHFLDIRLTHGGEAVSLTRRAAALYPPPPKEYSWYSFLLEAESIPGP